MDEYDRILGELGGEPKRRRKREKPAPAAPAGWGLVLSPRGIVEPCLHNALALLRQSYPLGGWVQYDEFSRRMLVREPGKPARQLSEADELDFACWLQRGHNTKFSLAAAAAALRTRGFEATCDVLLEHVRSVAWDGVPRVDAFVARYLGGEDTVYTRAVGRVLLLSMAARALRPGCQVDTVVILEGEQGAGKSTVVRVLGGEFFAELLAHPGTQAANEQVGGVWVMEIGELDSMSRAEVTAVKAFVSRLDDRFRHAYARTVTATPRRCIMVGTTNANAYLRDETGARRFLPYRVTRIDTAALREDRMQLIAEAVSRVEAGEPWWITDPEELDAARNETSDRMEVDPWTDALSAYLEPRTKTSVPECLSQLGVPVAQRTQREQNRVAKLLRILGYARVRVQEKNARRWLYVREITPGHTGTAASSGAEVGHQKPESFHDNTPPVLGVPLDHKHIQVAYINTHGLLEGGGAPGTHRDTGTGDENDADLSGPWDATGGEP